LIRRALVVGLLLVVACRSTRPRNAEPIAPLSATTPAEAAEQLAARRAQFRGQRSFIRLRMGQVSARGQLQVDSTGRLLLTIYTPLGTTAARLYVEAEDVIFLNDFDSTAWRGKASELANTIGMFGGAIPMLLVGLPSPGLESISYAAGGIESVRLPDAVITFGPAIYPPSHVTIDRGERRVEIQYLESFVDPETIKPPEIPNGYRCCVPPQI
jgi:hypothetical protein